MSANKSSQTLTKLAVALLVPVVAIIALVKSFSSSGSDPALLTAEAIENRIAPVAQYNTGAPAIVLDNGKKEPLSGEQVYKNICMSCHDAGLAGAPKKGDNGAWAPRIAQGEATVLKHAIEGLNGMPARGGNPNLSDLEVHRAVVFMVNASGGKFAEPAAEGEAKKDAAPAEAAPAQTAAPAETPAAAPVAAETPVAPAAGAVDADKALALANAKACMACHGVDNKLVGPAYKEVAAKGEGAEVLAASIKNGSSGKWGPVPMPANHVTDEEAALLAAWIASLK
ncbi:c-type cytochrome [Pelistega suis]|uniref:C-type cytochrome n=1 Tax=Pelistega suis TaxID=1631957 RepID=A0A849PBN3_9BURK|nr:c-type cytochrome [Pelistega suis]NOL52307.1 c-type cytochrome [Pelistega suis]